MTRRDKTQLPRALRADWEIGTIQEDMSSNREEQKQEELLNAWDNIYTRGSRGENIAEWDLARRISAVTEGDTREERVHGAIKEHKRTEIVDAKLREQLTRGQSEEQFYQEQDTFGKQYRKAVEQANREVR